MQGQFPDGSDVVIRLGNGLTERHSFATEQEARARCEFVTQALGWAGTPFRDCMAVKGRDGGVDCAMLLARSAIEGGLLPEFDPRPYPPRWHLHQDEERFLEWVETKLGGKVVDAPQLGDVVVWKFGRCFSHGAIVINSEEVIHSYYAAGCCLISRIDEPLLNYLPLAGGAVRPVRYYDLWSGVSR